MKSHWKLILGGLFVVALVTLYSEWRLQVMYREIVGRNQKVFDKRNSTLTPALWYYARRLLGMSNMKYIKASQALEIDPNVRFQTSPVKLGYLVMCYFSEEEVDSLLLRLESP
jgi:hypothetical protein